jgi:hypothetical protein
MKIFIVLFSFFIIGCTVNESEESEDYKIVEVLLNSDDLKIDLTGFDVFFYNHQDYRGFYGIKNNLYKKVPIIIENTSIIDSSKINFYSNIIDVKKINSRYDIIYGRVQKSIEDHSIIRNDTIFNIRGFQYASPTDYLIFDKLNSNFIPIPNEIFSGFNFKSIDNDLVNGILYCNSGYSENPTTINFNGDIDFGNFLDNMQNSLLKIINNSGDYIFTYYDNSSSQTKNKYHIHSLNLDLDLGLGYDFYKRFKSIDGKFYALNNYNQIVKVVHDNVNADYNVVYDFNSNPIGGETYLDIDYYIQNPLRNTTLIFGNTSVNLGTLHNYEFNHVNNTINQVSLVTNNIEYFTSNDNYLFYISPNDNFDYLIKKVSLQDYSEVYSRIITPAFNNDYLSSPSNIYLKNNGDAYYLSSSNQVFKLNILDNSNQNSQVDLPNHIGGFLTVLNDF